MSMTRKEAAAVASKKWREANKEKVTAYHKVRDPLYYKNNRDIILKRNVEYSRSNYERRIFNSCRKRARTSGLEFNLSLEDITIPEYCPYLKVKITNVVGEGKRNTLYNASIDRIDNSKGYTKDNIEVISTKANIMKNSASSKELYEFALAVMERFSK